MTNEHLNHSSKMVVDHGLGDGINVKGDGKYELSRSVCFQAI